MAEIIANIRIASPEPSAPVIRTELTTIVNRLLSKLSGSLGGKQLISEADAPTPVQREMLSRRAADLRTALMPGAPNLLAAAALDLFDGWPQVRMDDAKAADTGLTYGRQVEGFPLWAVQRAVMVCQGLDTPWPPASGQLKARVLAAVQPFRAELYRIEKILGAEVYRLPSPEEREAGMAKLQDLLRSLGIKANLSPRADADLTDPAG